MARNQNTTAKRNREMDKKRKAEEKLERRRRRKTGTEESAYPEDMAPDADDSDDPADGEQPE